MFCLFHKWKSRSQASPARFARAAASRSGQAALILILIIAVALIFYAVSLNLGDVSMNKTSVTIASNMAASLLGSQMASYGQLLFKETMGGTFKKCQTNWLSFASIIVAIILVVVTWGAAFPAVGAATAAATTAFVAAVVGLALTTISFILQVTVIQPGLTERWNAAQKGAPLKDQFAESGLQAAIIRAAGDPVQVIDRLDLDNDGVFGEAAGKPKDKISRFAVYYDERLRGGLRIRNDQFVRDFIDALTEFIEDNPFGLVAGSRDNWGVHDAASILDLCVYNNDAASPDYNVTLPSMCNLCCVPNNAVNEIFDPGNPICVTDPTHIICQPTVNNVPACCDAGGVAECGTRTTCTSPALSPYVTNRPLFSNIYDRYFQSAANNDNTLVPPDLVSISFIERLGRDDENPHYYKNTTVDPIPIGQVHRGGLAPFYTIDDASGVFPLMHYLDDWGLNLSTVNAATSIANEMGEQCFWYDENYEVGCAALVYETTLVRNNKLTLPEDPSTLFYNTTNHVDGTNPGAAILAADAVVPPDDLATPINVLMADSQCPFPDLSTGIFKKGSDAFCSYGDEFGADPLPHVSYYPYFAHCEKHKDKDTGNFCSVDDGVGGTSPVDCDCQDNAEPTLWHDDALDEIVYGMYEFLDWAYQFMAGGSGPVLANTFEDWYTDVAKYIETRLNCVICDDVPADARNYILEDLKDRLDSFYTMFSNYHDTGFADDNVWCVPTAFSCPACGAGACDPLTCSVDILAPGEERRTFNIDGAGPQGRIEDVIACLSYNIEGYDFNVDDVYADGTELGNDFRYERCGQTCSFNDCAQLPRPILPLLDRRSFAGGNPSASAEYPNFLDHQAFMRCLYSCSDTNCRPVAQGGTLPDVRSSNGVTPFIYPNPATDPFDQATDCAGTQLSGASTWKDEIDGNIQMVISPVDLETGKFLRCIDSCSQVNCTPTSQGGLLPLVRITDGITPYNYPGPWAGNPCAGWAPGNAWYDAIATNMALLNPVCDLTDGNPWAGGNLALSDVAGTGWLFKVRHNAVEARNQVEKFKQRRLFLVDLEARLVDAIDVFRWGRDNINDFLVGPAADLITARRNLVNNPVGSDTGYPNRIIYGWQTEAPPARMNLPPSDPNYQKGYWHIVKVEVGIPQKCLGSCGGSNETWPKVETYTKGFLGMTRCYELRHTTGIVKARVTRWDEDRDPSTLRFPNGQPIWDFRSAHSQRGHITLDSLIEGTCGPLPDHNTGLTIGGEYEGAFMVDESDVDAGGGGCWTRANGLLANGVFSETCAQYFGNNSADGFTFKFISCPSDW